MQARRLGGSPAVSTTLAMHEFDHVLCCAVDFGALAYEEETLDAGGSLGIHR